MNREFIFGSQDALKLSDFDFFLPNKLIAQKPAKNRDQSRLLVLDRKTGTIVHQTFSNIFKHIIQRPLMVFNNTEVIPAKLTGANRDTGKPIEALLIRQREPCVWEVMIKGLKRLKPGDPFIFGKGGSLLTAVLLTKESGRGVLRFSYSGDFYKVLDQIADMPLPPYIRRNDKTDPSLNQMDRERYQTVFAKETGAIAAPTAGLHFTGEALRALESENIADTAYLTLHVGPGTFSPIRVEEVTQHKMEKEFYQIEKNTWNRLALAKRNGQKILAVGTTSTRVLESVSLDGKMEEDVSGWTDRFIYPGQEFKNVDRLLTNFHLPKSSLYLLVCAFSGTETIRKAYREAIKMGYRFYSYGDAMLIL